MSPEVALLQETWEIVKTSVNSKDRLHVADSLLRAFDEHVDMSELEMYKNEFDKVMKAAISDFYDEYDVEEEMDDEW